MIKLLTAVLFGAAVAIATNFAIRATGPDCAPGSFPVLTASYSWHCAVEAGKQVTAFGRGFAEGCVEYSPGTGTVADRPVPCLPAAKTAAPVLGSPGGTTMRPCRQDCFKWSEDRK